MEADWQQQQPVVGRGSFKSSSTGPCKPNAAALAAAAAAAAALSLHASEAAAAKHVADAYLSLPATARLPLSQLRRSLLHDGLLWKGQMLTVLGYAFSGATQDVKGVFEVVAGCDNAHQLTLQCKTCGTLLQGNGLWDAAEQHCNRVSHHVSECVLFHGVLDASGKPVTLGSLVSNAQRIINPEWWEQDRQRRGRRVALPAAAAAGADSPGAAAAGGGKRASGGQLQGRAERSAAAAAAAAAAEEEDEDSDADLPAAVAAARRRSGRPPAAAAAAATAAGAEAACRSKATGAAAAAAAAAAGGGGVSMGSFEGKGEPGSELHKLTSGPCTSSVSGAAMLLSALSFAALINCAVLRYALMLSRKPWH
jgi:hypothetical protein